MYGFEHMLYKVSGFELLDFPSIQSVPQSYWGEEVRFFPLASWTSTKGVEV